LAGFPELVELTSKAPSPGRQSGGMCSTSPRLCQSVFLRGAVKGAGYAPVELDVSA